MPQKKTSTRGQKGMCVKPIEKCRLADLRYVAKKWDVAGRSGKNKKQLKSMLQRYMKRNNRKWPTIPKTVGESIPQKRADACPKYKDCTKDEITDLLTRLGVAHNPSDLKMKLWRQLNGKYLSMQKTRKASREASKTIRRNHRRAVKTQNAVQRRCASRHENYSELSPSTANERVRVCNQDPNCQWTKNNQCRARRNVQQGEIRQGPMGRPSALDKLFGNIGGAPARPAPARVIPPLSQRWRMNSPARVIPPLSQRWRMNEPEMVGSTPAGSPLFNTLSSSRSSSGSTPAGSPLFNTLSSARSSPRSLTPRTPQGPPPLTSSQNQFVRNFATTFNTLNVVDDEDPQ